MIDNSRSKCVTENIDYSSNAISVNFERVNLVDLDEFQFLAKVITKNLQNPINRQNDWYIWGIPYNFKDKKNIRKSKTKTKKVMEKQKWGQKK